MSRPNTLLDLPAELRVQIASIVFSDPDEYPPSHFRERALRPPTLQPVPFRLSLYHPLLHVCRLLRKEALPCYYANKTVELNGKRQLQDAIMRVADTLPMWKHLHIYWEHGSTPMPPRLLRPGYFKTSPDGDYDQLIERGFAQLKNVLNLRTLRVDFGALYWALPQPSGALDHTLIEHELCKMLSEHTELRSLEICAEALTQFNGLERAGKSFGFHRLLEKEGGVWVFKRSWTIAPVYHCSCQYCSVAMARTMIVIQQGLYISPD
ncbi:hypothetical protein LTR97_009604 [Elasticomyces elasticus]|uniref:Uncharacterized protein n=1 Tax=Elasticomyces elasticus TaxID=574655 RepID=A0AAN7ZX05_9PEZI|nr:hypothetical protein LTR97_009604 [Elasticomyces elasticus]